MNLQHIMHELENVDPEIYDRLDTRRNAMKNFAGLGKKLALAAVPIAFGGMINKAYGRDNAPSILDVLNYALTLEYLESSFYAEANAKGSSLIPYSSDRDAFKIIGDHEKEHVDFLTSAIKSSGGTPVSKPKFDFTAKGTFADVFSNYQTFLAVSQTFEDTGVRAYKGQATNLMSNNAVLTAALNIHSVEARHASLVREVRAYRFYVDIKPWITLNHSGINSSAVQASYNGEENTKQAGVQIIHIGNEFEIDADAASEAFDEPLTMDQVLAIAKPFFA